MFICVAVRFDNIGNMPFIAKNKQRCKACVKCFTKVMCKKCNVGLCRTYTKTCYAQYHKK